MSPLGGSALTRALRESHNEACVETQERNSILPETVAQIGCGHVDLFRIVELYYAKQCERLFLR